MPHWLFPIICQTLLGQPVNSQFAHVKHQEQTMQGAFFSVWETSAPWGQTVVEADRDANYCLLDRGEKRILSEGRPTEAPSQRFEFERGQYWLYQVPGT